ncbi:MAG TPA: putative sporulation protein YtxC [Methanobacterium sp.]|nr:putative sporulation protein YtxC [Methanobacterium sp.]
MYYQFVVSTAGNDIFYENLEQRFAWIKERGYKLNIDSQVYEQCNIEKICISLQGDNSNGIFRDEDVIYIFKHQLSEILADHIILNWEETIIWKEISRKYRRVSVQDKNFIYKKAIAFLKKCNSNESLNMLMNFGRKNKIANRVLEYIYDNDLLVVEGFINFCLPDYLKEIRFAIDLAYEELRNEKEYNEFIKLLRYFVDSQPAKTNEVNLLMEDEGFCLWDGKGTKIEEDFMASYMEDILLNEISLDDILISILITISPRRIIIHNNNRSEDSSSVEMIKNVFKDRIHVCRGCERCLLHNRETCKPH